MKPQFGLDSALESCQALNLNGVRLGGHLVVLNSGFDLTLSGEPYVALMLVLHLDSGKFITRVWNSAESILTLKNRESIHFG